MLGQRAALQVAELAVTAMREQGAAVAAVLARQVDVEAARVALERERFEYEKQRHAEADAERRAWREQVEGDDLPDGIQQEITRLAAHDPAIKAQLVRFARMRLEREIPSDQVRAELRRGTPAAAL